MVWVNCPKWWWGWFLGWWKVSKRSRRASWDSFQNRLQWGRSNLVNPTEWPKIGLLNRDFGSILSVFPRKKNKTQSSLNFLQFGPRKFTKSDFSGLAPIRRALIFSAFFGVSGRRPPPIYWEVLHGVGADGVGVKFPIFAVNCCCLALSFRRSREKRRKRGKMRRKRGKKGKITPTPSTPTLGVSRWSPFW